MFHAKKDLLILSGNLVSQAKSFEFLKINENLFCPVFWRRIIFFPTVLSRNKMYWDFWINALLIPLKYNKKFMCITYLCAFNCIRGNSRKHGQTLTKLSFLFQKMTENIKQIEAWRKVYSVVSVKRKQLKILRQLFLFWQESHKVLTLNV